MPYILTSVEPISASDPPNDIRLLPEANHLTMAVYTETIHDIIQERKDNISPKKTHTRAYQLVPAERMMSKVVMMPGVEGDNVAIPIPGIDICK